MSTTVATSEPAAVHSRSWRDLWQVPLLAVAAVLLVSGMATLMLTKPNPDVAGMVARAEGLLAEGLPEESLAVLNTEARPLINDASVSAETRQRFHAARAAAISVGQARLGADVEANHLRILEELDKAERAGRTLLDREHAIAVAALVALDRLEEAAGRIGMVSDDASDERTRLSRVVIERAMQGGQVSEALASRLLTDLGDDPMLTLEDRVWTLARRTELRLRNEASEEAIARLLRMMPRVQQADDAMRGELFLLLGESYVAGGALPEAAKQLERATSLLPPGDDLYARSMLAEGRVFEQLGDLDRARLRFEAVVGTYTASPSFRPALLSLGETLALISEVDPASATADEAVEVYALLADELLDATRRPGPILAETMSSLIERFEEQMARRELDLAAQYAQIAEDLVAAAGADERVLLSQARVNRARALQLVADALDIEPPGEGSVLTPDELGVELTEIDPSTRAQAQRWYVRAGDYFRRHADMLAGSDDDLAYADSVWNAAVMFDGGGDTAEAIASYVEFAGTIAGDPRVPAARFRLGRAYQASGEYELAAAQFEALLDLANDPERGRGVGPWGVRSYVPLAQVYLEDPDPANDRRASELLQSVLRGEAGDVESESFSDALAAMGMVHYYDGLYPSAIEQLEEAVLREGDSRESHKLKYLLADAYRLESVAITQTLGGGAVAPSIQDELEATREDHLGRAIELFAQVRDGLEAVPERRRTVLDGISLRNAYFYLGDCAFDLGDYDAAIRYYQIARDRYSDDAASLVALVQIFNAYFEAGDHEQARTASEKARRFYERLPEDAWDDPTLPMSRADWERWLDSSYELASLRADAQAAGLGG